MAHNKTATACHFSLHGPNNHSTMSEQTIYYNTNPKRTMSTQDENDNPPPALESVDEVKREIMRRYHEADHKTDLADGDAANHASGKMRAYAYAYDLLHCMADPAPFAPTFQDLTQRTLQWAKAKGIREEGTATGQSSKMLEEAIETWAALHGISEKRALELQEHAELIAEQAPGRTHDHRTDAEIRDGFGDIMVTLINTAAIYLQEFVPGSITQADSYLLGCWADVLDVIEQRSGAMQNGAFVKEDDQDA